MQELREKGHIGLLVWLLPLLVGALGGILVVSPRLNLLTLGLLAAVAALLFWVLRSVHMPLSRIEKGCCYLVFITGFLGAALFPIDLGPFALFPYRILLIVLWALFVARALAQGKLALPILPVKVFLAFLGIWFAYALISLSWSASKGDAIRHLIFLFMGVSLIFFASYYFRSHRDLHKFYWIWLGMFGGLILLGFWEHLTGQHLPASGYYGETRARLMFRPTGVFNNPNDYATFLALSIPFAFSVLRYARRWLARLIALGASIGAFYLIVATGSRANMLAVLLELAFLVLLLTNLSQKVKIALGGVACVAVGLFLFSEPIREFSLELARRFGSCPAEPGSKWPGLSLFHRRIWCWGRECRILDGQLRHL